MEPWFGVYRDGRRHLEGRSLDLGEGICGTAAALRQPVRVPNVQVDPRCVACVRDLDVASELAVPLLVEDRLIAVYDQRDRTLTLAGSGLPCPLLVRGGAVESLDVRGLPLGLLPEQEYRQTKLELRTGDEPQDDRTVVVLRITDDS